MAKYSKSTDAVSQSVTLGFVQQLDPRNGAIQQSIPTLI